MKAIKKEELPVCDFNAIVTSAYMKKIEKPWGYEIHWTPPNAPYCGKILHIDAGKRLSLQVHDQKTESWFLLSGDAKIVWDDASGGLIETIMEKGKGYSCIIGQRHRLVGVTDCDILEVSTPEIGTTFRLEDDYSRDHETEELRNQERKQ